MTNTANDPVAKLNIYSPELRVIEHAPKAASPLTLQAMVNGSQYAIAFQRYDGLFDVHVTWSGRTISPREGWTRDVAVMQIGLDLGATVASLAERGLDLP